jgi:hypothetical protein
MRNSRAITAIHIYICVLTLLCIYLSSYYCVCVLRLPRRNHLNAQIICVSSYHCVYICPHTSVYVASDYHEKQPSQCACDAREQIIYVCPRTTVYISVLILMCMCPHTTRKQPSQCACEPSTLNPKP